MSELKALLFDVDGTLADTERDGHRVAFNRAFADAGLDWEWDVPTYGHLLQVTGGKERMRFYLDDLRPDWPRPGEAELTEMIKKLHAAKTEHYTRMLGEGAVALRPGVERLIMEARQLGLRLAIATTTTPANVDALLRNTLGEQSLGWFEVIAAGDIVPAKKPAGDIYAYTLEQMNLTADQCLAFEDSENGIRSSSAVNIPTLVTVNGYTEKHDFSGAVVVLEELGELGRSPMVLGGGAGDCLRNGVDIAALRCLHARALM